VISRVCEVQCTAKVPSLDGFTTYKSHKCQMFYISKVLTHTSKQLKVHQIMYNPDAPWEVAVILQSSLGCINNLACCLPRTPNMGRESVGPSPAPTFLGISVCYPGGRGFRHVRQIQGDLSPPVATPPSWAIIHGLLPAFSNVIFYRVENQWHAVFAVAKFLVYLFVVVFKTCHVGPS